MSRRRPLIVSLAAGAALSLSACGGKKSAEDDLGPATSPPPSELDQVATPDPTPPPMPDEYMNPPPMDAPPPLTTAHEDTILDSFLRSKRGLPAYDEVKSPHPEGATNPPSPVLIVTPSGDCLKTWEGGMIPSGGDRVEVMSPGPAATAIQCPPERARATYLKWIEDGRPDPTEPGFPPKPKTP